jgi:hypothetical protein
VAKEKWGPGNNHVRFSQHVLVVGTINVGWESEVVRGAWRVVDVGPRDILYLDYDNLASVPMIFFRDPLVAELGWPHYTGVDPATWFVYQHFSTIFL